MRVLVEPAKVGVIIFVASILQVTLFSSVEILGGTPDVVLLTIAGYWIGRYGETTGRDRAHAPYVSVAVATILVQFGALFLHYMLGDSVSARVVLLDALPAKVGLNLLLTLPVYALVRRALALGRTPERVTEVQLLG